MAAKKGFNVMPFIGLAAAGGAAFFLYKKFGKNFEKNFRLLKMKIVGINKHENDMTVSVKVLNPSNANMEIKSFVGNVLFNGKAGGDVKMFGDYNIKSNSEMEIPLVVQSRGKPQMAVRKVTFQGTINVNNNALPIKLSYSR